jgi:hypothetical protein
MLMPRMGLVVRLSSTFPAFTRTELRPPFDILRGAGASHRVLASAESRRHNAALI